MKKLNLNFLAILCLLATAFVACEEDDDDNSDGTVIENDNVIVTTNITTDTRWTSDKIYQLAGRISVEDGATLTIDAGTVIKGETGTGSNATALVVARGAKLMAEGTATMPIIFTTVADEITPEDVAAGVFYKNMDPTINGLWGGVILLGKAPISASNEDATDATEVQIEGIPTSDANGLYGGNESEDNSGSLKYISIRHGGANIGKGNEINGLTLGGVGNKTMIDQIEIVSNQDDGIEFFGGTVNVTNLVSWNVGDDGVDTDQAWTGTLDNFVVITPAGHCFELDGPEGSLEGGHTIKNGTIIATSEDITSKDLVNVDANSDVSLENIYFMTISSGQKINEDKEDKTLDDAPKVLFTDVTINTTEDIATHVDGTVPTGVTVGTTGGADKSGFSWTWASKAGAL